MIPRCNGARYESASVNDGARSLGVLVLHVSRDLRNRNICLSVDVREQAVSLQEYLRA